MTEGSLPELLAGLRAEDSLTVSFAVGELRKLGDPAAVEPLVDALSEVISSEEPNDYLAADMIATLAELGDTRAAAVVRRALTWSAAAQGDAWVVTEAAADALVGLRDVDAVPLLERLLTHPGWTDRATLLAPALAALAGADAGPFLERLLDARDEGVVAAAAAALGATGHRAATPRLHALRTATDVNVRVAAFQALAAMGALDSPTDVRAQLVAASGWHEKSRLVALIGEARMTDATPLLVGAATDPAWVQGIDELRVRALATAAGLDDDQAAAHLQAIVADPGMSPCTRGHAATVLLELGDGRYLEQCLAFVRSGGKLPDGGLDPRDGLARRNERLVATVQLLERYATPHPGVLLPILDVLDPLRRGPRSPAQGEAREAVRRLTGIERYAEYDAWRAAPG